MSIRLRITLLFVAALALLASLGSLLSYVVVRNDLRGRASDSARALARSAAAVHEVEGEARSLDRLAAPGDLIWLVDGTGKVRASTFGASGTTLDAVRAVVSDRRGHGWVSAEAPRPEGGLAIVAQDDHATRDTLGTLAWVLVLAALGGLLVAAVAGAVLAARVLRPVDRMRREVDAIPGHELNRRVAEGRPDELGRLARAFNRLLVRAEDASRAQREFVADASHELKTPVTAVGGHARLAARAVASGDAERARESLEVVQRESMRMAATLRELLTLAEVGAAPTPTGTVDLGRVTADAVEEVRATAPIVRCTSTCPTPRWPWWATGGACASCWWCCWTTPCATAPRAAPWRRVSPPPTPARRWRCATTAPA
ncbi:MAG: HAMP domain-containing sensor histidine kinase [Thermoleophilia bacterium]